MARMIHNSFWVQQDPLRARFKKLSGKHETEVLVMGAGIAGLSVAIELASRGRRVTVCEAQMIGAGTTGGSTGHLDFHPEMGPAQLLRQLGEPLARDYIQLRRRAIERVAEFAGNQCDLVRIPAFQYSESEKDEDQLREDFEAAEQLGLEVAWRSSIPFPQAQVGYEISGTARIDPAKYLKRLTDLAIERGVSIFEQTLVTSPSDKDAHVTSAGDGEVHYDQLVCAVHSNSTPALHIYAATPPYQSYVMTVKVAAPLKDALFWDNSNPYYYTRLAKTGDDRQLLVGGCDHRTGFDSPLESLQNLEKWVRARFEVTEIISHWSAELFEPTDGLPMIGKAYGDNFWVTTGLSGVGLTLGTASGELIANMLDGVEQPLADALAPSRLGMGRPLEWLREQATSLGDLAERILPAKQLDPDALKSGEGDVGKLDGKHVAFCRDKLGCEHRHSPLCTHMGGVVHWNEVEQTWDCPFHGGRFAANGDRIYGPPISNLEKAEDQ